MSEIRSACLLQRLDDGILSLTLCVRHAVAPSIVLFEKLLDIGIVLNVFIV
jgi:hypothetical protein